MAKKEQQKNEQKEKTRIFFSSEQTQDKEGDFNMMLDLGKDLELEAKRDAIKAQQDALKRKREQERETEEDDE